MKKIINKLLTPQELKVGTEPKAKRKKTWPRFMAIIFVGMGLFFLLNASFPILTYEMFSSKKFIRTELLSPLAEARVLSFTTDSSNLNDANNWFVGGPNLPEVSSKVKYYNISIPKLKIKNAVVEIGGTDLKKSLIHYKGAAVPGQPGNAVIFGHSALPQFFSPSNYLTIFTKLPTLKHDDEIFVDYDGVQYKFEVIELFEVQPTDIQVLEQRMDDSYITLITCVPPGTYLRRLVIKARIVPIQ